MMKWVVHPAVKGASLLEQILINRRIDDPSFLTPQLKNLRDPFEIPNITAGANRVLAAKERGEKVMIYGDYDVDGITGTVILLLTLRLLGFEPGYYIPHRYGEGYSLSTEAVKKIAADGYKLIVTVDCGISSLEEIALAKQLGLEVVVTDHHNIPEVLPAATAVINPKMITGEHPSKYLSGSAVAFKFAWAILRLAGIKDNQFLTSLLDLAALGTFSDVVPLKDENRIIAVGGLRVINERKRVGLAALLEAAGVKGRVTENQIYFGLAPRLNAAGRLEHAAKSVELLMSEDRLAAKTMAEELNRINVRRQNIGSSIKAEVLSRLTDEYLADHKLVLMSGQEWHPGVIGIVASQVAETYCRPTVLIGINEGMGRGSARSVPGFNIYELLNIGQEYFLDFGGHEGAAGFEILPENIEKLQHKLTNAINERLKAADLVPQLEIDAVLEPEIISLNLIKGLDQLAPFGEGNPPPVFLTQGLTLIDQRTVGKDGRHLKLWLEKAGNRLEAVGFGLGPSASKARVGSKYDIAYNLEANEWNGFESAQFSLIDFKEVG